MCQPGAFSWAGDQLLWKLRVPGGNDVVGSGLESTSASGDFHGRVSYFHAGGIDKPLLITKEGVESVVPRETWRGQFHKGTSPATGLVRDCAYGGQTGCLLIAWPGMQTNAAHSWGEQQPDIRVWYGGLVDGMRDASGQMYMRNRYYDPATGQFTQTDPIGIAGGLNAYGFAAGDPVTYSDPYGLCADDLKDKRGRCPGGWDDTRYRQIESYIQRLDPGAREGLMGMLEGGQIRRHGGALYYGREAGSPRGRIVLASEFFNDKRDGYETADQRAFVLAHEYGHQLQRQQRSLLYLPMNGRSISAYFNAGRGTPLHNHWQNDANVYACRHSTNVARGNWQTDCNSLGVP